LSGQNPGGATRHCQMLKPNAVLVNRKDAAAHSPPQTSKKRLLFFDNPACQC
jgi:hypothetical protein